jgi:hypothetical protein
MSERPPPVPSPPSRPPGDRPGVVTGAGVLLIIGGILGMLLGILLLGGAGAAGGAGAGGLFTGIGLLSVVVGAVQTYAGVQVLNLREIGRVLGIGIAAVSALFALLSVGRAPGAILTILIDLFIIYALTQNKEYFSS